MINLITLNESVSGEKLFNLSTTGTSMYDDFLNDQHDYMKLVKGKQGHIEMMTPYKYLATCANRIFKRGTSGRINIEEEMHRLNYQDILKYKGMMESGTKFHLPYLNYVDSSQEGRHRICAAYLLGAKKVPVLVVTKYNHAKELGFPNKSFKLWYGHTLQYKSKDGTPTKIHVGLNVEAMKDTIKDILKSKDYLNESISTSNVTAEIRFTGDLGSLSANMDHLRKVMDERDISYESIPIRSSKVAKLKLNNVSHGDKVIIENSGFIKSIKYCE